MINDNCTVLVNCRNHWFHGNRVMLLQMGLIRRALRVHYVEIDVMQSPVYRDSLQYDIVNIDRAEFTDECIFYMSLNTLKFDRRGKSEEDRSIPAQKLILFNIIHPQLKV